MKFHWWKQRRGCLSAGLTVCLLISSFLISIPASAATSNDGTLPGVYPPVYPLKRPSYGVDSFPLKRNPLGTTKYVLGGAHACLLTNQGKIQWLDTPTSLTAEPYMDTASWTDIVDVELGYYWQNTSQPVDVFTIALDKNGNAFAAGNTTAYNGVVAKINDTTNPDNPWKQGNLVQVAVGCGHFVGLTKDGKLISTGRDDYKQASTLNGITNVVKIRAQEHTTMALLANGTVRFAGGTTFGANLTYTDATLPADWRDPNQQYPIVDIATERYAVAILRSNGKVYYKNIHRSYLGSGTLVSANAGYIMAWENVVKIIAGDAWLMGLRSDGSVVRTGYGSSGNWRSTEYPPNGAVITASTPPAFDMVQGPDNSAAVLSNGRFYACGTGTLSGSRGLGWVDTLNSATLTYPPVALASPGSGYYVDAQTITLTSSEAGSQQMYYTISTNGTEPPEPTAQNGTLYRGSFTIDKDCIIKTRVIDSAFPESQSRTYWYRFVETGLLCNGVSLVNASGQSIGSTLPTGQPIQAQATLESLVDQPLSAWLVMVVSKGNAVKFTTCKRIAVTGLSTVTAKTDRAFTADGTGYHAKAFLLLNFASMHPIGSMAEANN